MEYTTCPRCGKFFYKIVQSVCQACITEEEAQFVKLKEYLDENRMNNIARTAKETGIPMKRIVKYLEEGRIEMTAGMLEDNPLTCGRCGTSVTVGTLCEQCKIMYNRALQGLRDDSNKKDRGTGMHSRKEPERRR